jgi:lysyl-tRNA synthetase class 2
MYSFADLDPFAARRAKLQAFIDLGVDPFPARTPDHEQISVIREKGAQLFEAETGEVLASNQAAGRIMALRGQGALFFMDLQDESGKIQLLFKKDTLPSDLWDQLELLDLGDFIWVSGDLFVTKRGELTIDVETWKILTKSLRPLPDLWKGLQDIETRQRQRYAELIVSPETKERFVKRSKFIIY